MASIDRYRPPREGYQPPTINKPRPDQQNASPSSRNEVPPAAPTPPQRSSRTSPPRPDASRGQSPRASRAQSPVPEPSQWSFTANEVISTPSVVDGLSLQEERLRRAKGVNFIYQAGVMLDLPQITLWVAGVFFHRFYMRYSMVPEKGGIHHYNIAATALFLANKVEENCRKTKDIIIAVAKVAQKNPKLIIDEQSKEYWLWRDSILMYEEIMLEQLTFDLMVDNPYRNLFELLGQLDIVHNKNLRQAAWTFCNDACLTSIPLLFEPRDVAISAIFFGSVHTNQQIDDIRGEPWWRYLDGDEGSCTQAIDVMRQFYTENPLRKQNPSLPSPPYFLENTRRRADTLMGQSDMLSSNSATPLDRRSRSPAVMATNGDRQMEPRSHAEPPLSPAKRKDTVDSPADGTRAEKRARMSEDEGEIEG